MALFIGKTIGSLAAIIAATWLFAAVEANRQLDANRVQLAACVDRVCD